MRLLKALLTGILAVFAVIAGLFATALVALTGIAVLLTRRWLRRGAGSHAQQHARPRPQRASTGDAIDVVATEIPADRTRLPQ